MPDHTDPNSLSSVKLDPFPLVIGTEEERIEWFARHADQGARQDVMHWERQYPRLAAEGRARAARRDRLEQRAEAAEDRYSANARRNQAHAHAGRARSGGAIPTLPDGPPPTGPTAGPTGTAGEARAADPDLSSSRGPRITAEELIERLKASTRRPTPDASDRLVAALEGFLGTKAQQKHHAQVPMPVEIRRPDLAPVEVFAQLVTAALNVSLGIAVVRAAARRVFGVDLSRRDAWLLMAAGAALTRGSGWQVWTRQQRKAGR